MFVNPLIPLSLFHSKIIISHIICKPITGLVQLLLDSAVFIALVKAQTCKTLTMICEIRFIHWCTANLIGSNEFPLFRPILPQSVGKYRFFFHLYEQESLVSDLPLMFMDFPLAHTVHGKLFQAININCILGLRGVTALLYSEPW